MRKTNRTKLMAVVLAGACVLLGTGMTVGAEDDKVYEIKLTSTDALTTIWHEEHLAMAERIKERTDGHVDIQLYGNGEFMVYDEGVEAVISDSAVFYWTDPNLFSDYCPEFMTIQAPYLWENYEEIEAFEQTDICKDIFEKAEAENVHAVSPMTCIGTRHILADKPVTTVEDCKGLSIRVPASELYTKTFDAFGCNYQGLAWSEVYNALETGMITAVESTPSTVVNSRPDESMKGDKYYSLNGHMLNCAVIFCGEGFWNSLPEEYQEIITEEAAASAATINRKISESAENEIKEIADFGITVVDVPDKSSFREAVEGMNSEMVDWDKISTAVQEIREAK